MKSIKIYEGIGECISRKSFCEQVAKLVDQTADMVSYALSFIEEEQGEGVESMETYCAICEIETY